MPALLMVASASTPPTSLLKNPLNYYCCYGWSLLRYSLHGILVKMNCRKLIFSIYRMITPTLDVFQGELSFPQDQQVEQWPEP